MTSDPNSILVAAAIGASLNPLNSTMVAVALPALSVEFGSPARTVTLFVVTGYLVATIVSQLPAGTVADRVGYARALTWGRLIFGAGAALGFLAPSLAIVVAGRLLMAAGGALVIPTAMALLRIAVPAERRSRAFEIFDSRQQCSRRGGAVACVQVGKLGPASLTRKQIRRFALLPLDHPGRPEEIQLHRWLLGMKVREPGTLCVRVQALVK